jgi:ribulose-phosphate 3-epimerase
MSARTLSVETPVIAPSILKVDYADFLPQLRKLEAAGAKTLHWDVMDGHFVPNLSYGAMVIKSVRSRTELFFDAHLMISEPGRYLDDYLQAGCDALTIHIEAVPEPAELLQRIRAAGRKSGLAINPGTPLERIEPFLADCDQVLVMSVEPGFGGQSFMPEVLGKAEALKAQGFPWISIDGGIAPGTIEQAAAAGVRYFVVGSAIFDEPDYTLAIRDLESRAQSH